jgi:hypothetical protein
MLVYRSINWLYDIEEPETPMKELAFDRHRKKLNILLLKKILWLSSSRM